MKHKPKIAIYSGDVPSTTFIERLIDGLSQDACKVYVFGFLKSKKRYSGDVTVFAYKNTKLCKFFYLIKYTILLTLFKYKDKKKLDGILKTQSKNVLLDRVKTYPVLWHKPDVFHLQWVKGLDNWMWVQNFGIKLVVSLRGAHINYSPLANKHLAAMYREDFPKVDGFHAVSKAIANEAEKYNASDNRIKVVYSGLSPKGNEPLQRIPNKTFQIISIGRAHWKKGYTFALDACKALKDNNFKFKYTIVGASNSIECQYHIYDLGLSEEVDLVDKLPYDEVQSLMQQSDLLLLPSVEEGIANVVLEAMVNGTLVLTTDCGGMEEVIKDGNNGFVTKVRDVEAMVNKIKIIAGLSQKEIDSIKRNALESIKENHTQQHMVKDMQVLYQNVLQC